jgi:hypothetical protein
LLYVITYLAQRREAVTLKQSLSPLTLKLNKLNHATAVLDTVVNHIVNCCRCRGILHHSQTIKLQLQQCDVCGQTHYSKTPGLELFAGKHAETVALVPHTVEFTETVNCDAIPLTHGHTTTSIMLAHEGKLLVNNNMCTA